MARPADADEITDLQTCVGRLLEQPDFRHLIASWLEMGANPWPGPVSPEQAHEASYVNGRASFVQSLMRELAELYPDHHRQIEEERIHVRRSLAQLVE